MAFLFNLIFPPSYSSLSITPLSISLTYIHTSIHTNMHTLHAYIYTSIHTYIHSYIHMYIHTYIHTLRIYSCLVLHTIILASCVLLLSLIIKFHNFHKHILSPLKMPPGGLLNIIRGETDACKFYEYSSSHCKKY